MRHFLQYWKSREADMVVGKPIDHAGSAQFTRVKPDDLVWIVNCVTDAQLLGDSRVRGHFAVSGAEEIH